jgi:hypothetical protein
MFRWNLYSFWDYRKTIIVNVIADLLFILSLILTTLTLAEKKYAWQWAFERGDE